ncbi:uncharacterized protein BDFB_005938 [Asbolus verrucosus]|uniref:Uncharacterized protein n=1 Tax=Asbolus verrucosus TaxID=1661398 RepID=A0A482VQB6_ASBVE|nr:uncharacterized protein BDFB_005938 [Asbolus verrucosus]
MKQYVWTLAILVCLVAFCSIAESRSLVKREANGIGVNAVAHGHGHEHVEVAFGLKNAVLGFVFHKINSFIDKKTHWVDQLDYTNIAKNKAHGIEPPKDPVVSLSGIISGVIGQKLQAAGPLLTLVTNKLTAGSSSGGHQQGFNFGSLLGGGKPSGFAWETTTTTTHAPTTTEDIVIFEKDKNVSLDIPGELFASSYTLVTNLSNTVGDFMINSALRAQKLLESMRPFLWKVFGAKGIVIEATTDKPIFSDPNSS